MHTDLSRATRSARDSERSSISPPSLQSHMPSPPVLSNFLSQAKHHFAIAALPLDAHTILFSTLVVSATAPAVGTFCMTAKRARAAGDRGRVCEWRSWRSAPGPLSVKVGARGDGIVGPHDDDTLAGASCRLGLLGAGADGGSKEVCWMEVSNGSDGSVIEYCEPPSTRGDGVG